MENSLRIKEPTSPPSEALVGKASDSRQGVAGCALRGEEVFTFQKWEGRAYEWSARADALIDLQIKSTRPKGLGNIDCLCGAIYAIVMSGGSSMKNIGPDQGAVYSDGLLKGGGLVGAQTANAVFEVPDHAFSNVELFAQLGAGQTALLAGPLEVATYGFKLLRTGRTLHNATHCSTQLSLLATPCSLLFEGGR